MIKLCLARTVLDKFVRKREPSYKNLAEPPLFQKFQNLGTESARYDMFFKRKNHFGFLDGFQDQNLIKRFYFVTRFNWFAVY